MYQKRWNIRCKSNKSDNLISNQKFATYKIKQRSVQIELKRIYVSIPGERKREKKEHYTYFHTSSRQTHFAQSALCAAVSSHLVVVFELILFLCRIQISW